MARGPRIPRLSRVALYDGVDERDDLVEGARAEGVEGARE